MSGESGLGDSIKQQISVEEDCMASTADRPTPRQQRLTYSLRAFHILPGLVPFVSPTSDDDFCVLLGSLKFEIAFHSCWIFKPGKTV